MPESTVVTLPKASSPKFPDICVDCGLAEPGCLIKVSTRAIGWWTYLFWMPGARFTVDVPCCQSCRRRMIQQRWARRIVCVAMAVAGVAVAGYLLGSLRGILARWLAMGIVLLCMAPFFAWEIIFPLPIDLTAYSDRVDYEFRSEEYADDFLTLN